MAAPDIKYRGQRERQAWDLPNGLEAYVEGSIVPYYRVYRREQNPNADYSPRVAIAVRMSNAIDDADNNPHLMDQVIWGVTHQNDCHPGVQWIVDNPALVDLLLIRNFKAHGGIALPPLPLARERQEAHERVAAQEAQQHMTWMAGTRTIMRYPTWQENKDFEAARGSGNRGGSHSSPRGGGGTGRGGLSSRGGRGRGY